MPNGRILFLRSPFARRKTLPRQATRWMIPRRDPGDLGARLDEDDPVRVAVRKLARGALAEELVELLLLHLQQIRQVERHPGSL